MSRLTACLIALTLAPPLTATAHAQTLIGHEMDSGFLFDVNPSTGTASRPRPTGVNYFAGIASIPRGELYGLSTFISPQGANSLFRIDPATGAAALVGPTGLPRIVEGDLTYDPRSGMLYGLTNHIEGTLTRQLFRIDPATGQATITGPVNPAFEEDMSAMGFAPDGTLYVIDLHSFGGRLLSVNPDNGQVLREVVLQRPVNEFLGRRAGMAFVPTTGQWYVVTGGLGFSDGTESLYTLDTVTGGLDLVGRTGVDKGLAGLAFVVPEPVLAAPLALATLLLARVRPYRPRRR